MILLFKTLSVIYEIYRFLPSFIFAVYFIIKHKAYKYKIKKVQTSKRNLVVLGNGPSLKNDLIKIKKENADFFCVNHFADFPDFEELKPKLYLFLDPYFWSENTSLDYQNKREKTFENLNLKVNWGMDVYIPSYAHSSLVKKIINPNVNFITYSGVGIKRYPPFFERALLNTSIFSPYAINVIVHAVFIGSHIGYKTIRLYGVDTSVFLNLDVDQTNNKVYAVFKHFYGEKRVLQDEAGLRDTPLTLSECLDKEVINFKSYELLSRYCKSINIELINCSSYSLIDSINREV